MVDISRLQRVLRNICSTSCLSACGCHNEGSVLMLSLVLFFIGLVGGWVDLSINAQGIAYEAEYDENRFGTYLSSRDIYFVSLYLTTNRRDYINAPHFCRYHIIFQYNGN